MALSATEAANKLLVQFVREATEKRLAPFAPFTEDELASAERRVAALKKQHPDLHPELAARLDENVEQIRKGLEAQRKKQR
jgi:hypothetical protein